MTVALMAEHDDARQNDNSRAGSVHGCMQSACLHAVFPTPYPAVGGTGGLNSSGADAEYDDARQASRQCARTCGALTRVRRACWWRAQQAVPTSITAAKWS